MKKNKKFLIYGNGWIGNLLYEFLNNLGYEVAIDKGNIVGIVRPTKVMEWADVWINTAAKTDIDWCEKNKSETLGINALAAANLAGMAKELKKKYVFISSACIFESKNRKDIKLESSQPNPACFYALSKWIAEELIMECNPSSLIVRPRLPISSVSHPRNTLNKLLKYKFLNDNQESVTVIDDMLPVLHGLIQHNQSGIVHLVNEGTVSPAQLGKLLGHKFKLWRKDTQDREMVKKGRARRVTTYVGSERIALLPNVKSRLREVIDQFKAM